MSALAVSAIAQRELKKNISNLWLPLVAGVFFVANLVVVRIGFSYAGSPSSVDARALLLSLIHLQMRIHRTSRVKKVLHRLLLLRQAGHRPL